MSEQVRLGGLGLTEDFPTPPIPAFETTPTVPIPLGSTLSVPLPLGSTLSVPLPLAGHIAVPGPLETGPKVPIPDLFF